MHCPDDPLAPRSTILIIIQLVGWYVLAVNTNGLTLEEIALLFEKPEGAVPDVDHAVAVAQLTHLKANSKYDDESLRSPSTPGEGPSSSLQK